MVVRLDLVLVQHYSQEKLIALIEVNTCLTNSKNANFESGAKQI